MLTNTTVALKPNFLSSLLLFAFHTFALKYCFISVWHVKAAQDDIWLHHTVDKNIDLDRFCIDLQGISQRTTVMSSMIALIRPFRDELSKASMLRFLWWRFFLMIIYENAYIFIKSRIFKVDYVMIRHALLVCCYTLDMRFIFHF